MEYQQQTAEGYPAGVLVSHPVGSSNSPWHFILQKPGYSCISSSNMGNKANSEPLPLTFQFTKQRE